jgi:D-alanyl-D-alanine carboxypeptidase/D-alanyl-D-alanine-endopeptidase (penicillin-binding protein 4)
MLLRSCSFIFVVLWFTSVAAGQEDLKKRIDAVMNRPEYKQAHWGVLVVDAKSGKTVYEHNAEKLFTPASTTKLYTCASMLAMFGPDYKFETPVYRRGEIAGGVLQGDLILVASGDFTLGGRTDGKDVMAYADNDHTYADPTATKTAITETDPLAGLNALARQVRQADIRIITGDVLIDDRLFPTALGTGSGPGLLTPMMVNDNVVDVLVSPGSAVGQMATVRCRPATAFVQMDAQVETVAKTAPPYIEVRSVGPQRFAVRGRIPIGSKPLVRIWPVDEPVFFGRALFIECLRKAGVEVRTSELRRPTSELPDHDQVNKLPRVGSFVSPPLSEAIKVTLKVSHNLYASTMPLLIATKNGQSTIADGLRWQRRFLKDLDVPVETISFAGGAGGANADCTTPRATVALIQAMKQRKEYAAWHAALPVLGVDGTLAESVPGISPAKGKVFAKTGTISWFDSMNNRTLLRSKALAGTMTTASGTELTFAMFVNDVPLPAGVPTTREGKTLGHICELIFEYGP